MAGKGKIGEFIEGKARGALENLSDVFTSKDAPVDESRRQFIKQAPVATAGGAGALAGIGTAAAMGAKALFSQGKFDNILEKVKSAFDEDWQNISLNTTDSPTEILQKKLEIDDNDFAKMSEETGMFEQLDMFDLDPSEMSSGEVAQSIKDLTDSFMRDFSWDHMKGRGDNPSVLIDEFKIPAFKLEVEKNFPGLDQDEIDDLAKRLF